jgi:hypothetical protein
VHSALTPTHVEVAEHIERRLGGVFADERHEGEPTATPRRVIHREMDAVEVLGTHLRKQTTEVCLFDVVRQVAHVERAVGVVARGRGTTLSAASTGTAEAATGATASVAASTTASVAASAAALIAAVAATLAAA